MLLWLAMACAEEREPRPAAETCPDGQILDGEACVPEGCGAGAWGGLSGDLYVDAGAEDGGDGSMEAPFRSIGEAIAADGGARVVVAAGAYAENLLLSDEHDGLEVAGRCAELVAVDGAAGLDQSLPVVDIYGSTTGIPDIRLSGLTLTGGDEGVWAENTTLTLEGAILTGNRYGGVRAEGARTEVILAETLIAANLAEEGVLWGCGIYAYEGADIAVSASRIEGNSGRGIYAVDAGTVVTLEDTVVRGTLPLSDGSEGVGAYASRAAVLSASGSAFLENTTLGVGVDAGAEVALERVEIRGTLPRDDGLFGWGAQAWGGGELRLVGCTVADNADIGLVVEGAGSALTAEDTAVLATRADPNGDDGEGIYAFDQGYVEARRVVVAGNRSAGISVVGGASAELEEVRISGTWPETAGDGGFGLSVRSGAAVSASRCRIEGNADAGVSVEGQGSTAFLEDVDIAGTAISGSGTRGYGLLAIEGAAVEVVGGRLEGNHHAGLVASDAGTAVTLDGTVISGTRPLDQPFVGSSWGVGLQVVGGASLSARGCLIEGSAYFGVGVAEEGSAVTLEECAILDTAPDEAGLGVGLLVEGGAAAIGRGCAIERSTLVGAWVVGENSALALEECAVRGTAADADGWWGIGVRAEEGASLALEGSVLEENRFIGLLLWGAQAEVIDTEIRSTEADDRLQIGLGAYVYRGSALTMSGGALRDNIGGGMVVGGWDPVGSGEEPLYSTASLSGVRILDTRRDARTYFATGLTAQRHARIEAAGLEVSGTEGPGLILLPEDSWIRCEGCTLAENTFAGALVTSDGALELVQSAIFGNGPDASEGGGVGVYARDYGEAGYNPTSLRMEGCAVSDHPYAGVWLSGQGMYWLEGNDVRGGSGVEPVEGLTLHGDGLFATDGIGAWDADGGTGLHLQGNTFAENVGVGVFLDGASAALAGNAFSGNDLDLLQQRCEETTPLAEPEGAAFELCPDTNRLVDYLDYSGLFYLDEEVL